MDTDSGALENGYLDRPSAIKAAKQAADDWVKHLTEGGAFDKDDLRISKRGNCMTVSYDDSYAQYWVSSVNVKCAK